MNIRVAVLNGLLHQICKQEIVTQDYHNKKWMEYAHARLEWGLV